jgi:predicted permease
MYDISQAIAQALAPICFSILLGWIAGRAKLMPIEYSKALARFVTLFALPIALFLAAAKADPADIFNIRMLLAPLVGFGVTFLLGVLPTATEVSAIAVSRNIYRASAAGSTIASVLMSVVTISAGVAMALVFGRESRWL